MMFDSKQAAMDCATEVNQRLGGGWVVAVDEYNGWEVALKHGPFYLWVARVDNGTPMWSCLIADSVSRCGLGCALWTPIEVWCGPDPLTAVEEASARVFEFYSRFKKVLDEVHVMAGRVASARADTSVLTVFDRTVLSSWGWVPTRWRYRYRDGKNRVIEARRRDEPVWVTWHDTHENVRNIELLYKLGIPRDPDVVE